MRLHRRFLLSTAASAALLLAGCGSHSTGPATEKIAITPVLALEHVTGHSLFYNGVARGWLLKLRPDLLPEAEKAADSEKARSMAQAVQSGKLFRQLDRQYRFDSLLLTGDPSEYRPLLDHLLDSQDWKLAYLDQTSLIFERSRAQPWTPAEVPAVTAKLAGLPGSSRALCLAQIASKEVAVRELGAGKEMVEQAEKADEAVPEVWSAQAELRMAQGDWTGAIASANRALKLDPECLPALGAKAQSLYASKRFAEAFDCSSRLIAKLPDEPGILFYHAKIAHEARHFSEKSPQRPHAGCAGQRLRPFSSADSEIGCFPKGENASHPSSAPLQPTPVASALRLVSLHHVGSQTRAAETARLPPRKSSAAFARGAPAFAAVLCSLSTTHHFRAPLAFKLQPSGWIAGAVTSRRLSLLTSPSDQETRPQSRARFLRSAAFL